MLYQIILNVQFILEIINKMESNGLKLYRDIVFFTLLSVTSSIKIN